MEAHFLMARRLRMSCIKWIENGPSYSYVHMLMHYHEDLDDLDEGSQVKHWHFVSGRSSELIKNREEIVTLYNWVVTRARICSSTLE